MKKFTLDDLEILARGCAILGSGGGGDPLYSLLMAKYVMQDRPVTLIEVDELEGNELIVPLACVGAPSVSLERLPNYKKFVAIIEAIDAKSIVLMPAEIGGGNAFTPLIVAAMMGLPVLNADLLGRAFPELQMSTATLSGVSPSPAYLADPFGKVTKIEPTDCFELEKMARDLVTKMGSSGGIAAYLMRADRVKGCVVEGSYDRALEVGAGREESTLLGSGRIIDIEQKVENGFLIGRVTLDSGLTIDYQNEYLVAREGKKMIGASPDILMLIEQESALPIPSESLCFGLRVDLVMLPSPEIWKSAEGMKLVGGLLCE